MSDNRTQLMRKLIICLCVVAGLLLLLGPASICLALSMVDSDGDGWPDEYETKLGADPQNPANMPNALDDPDQDTLKNVEERNAGTDPTNPDMDGDGLSDAQEVRSGDSDPRVADTDKDGLSDFDEALSGTNPSRPDTDGDGWLDGAEKRAGTDPTDPLATPKGF